MRETFYRFWGGTPNANNTAANTSDFVSMIEKFLSKSKKVRQECTRILQGSRLGNNSFRKITHTILTNVRFRGVLFADRPPTFESEIDGMVQDCECNCVDVRSQNLVRTQLCEMISVNALAWPGIMNVTSAASTPFKRAKSSTEVPTTPVNKQCTSEGTPSYSTHPMSKESKSTHNLQLPVLKVEDCRFWSACFAEAIVAEDVLDNIEVYLGFVAMPEQFVEAATNRRLRSLWHSMRSPIPSPRDDGRGIIISGKNRQHVFDVARVLVLAVQISDTHTNSKMRDRSVIISTATR